jgi:hypothetical protein
MAKIDLVFSDKELKALDRKQRAALKKHAIHLVRTSAEIRDIIKKDPKIRRKLRAKLRGLHGRLKRRRRKK